MTSWVDGFPEASSAVECQTGEHRISWRHGKLVVHDHDVTAERALAALGGELPICIEVVDAWRACTRDPTLLVELLRGRARPPREGLLAIRQRWASALSALGATTVSTVSTWVSSSPARAPALRAMQSHQWRRSVIEHISDDLRAQLIASLALSLERSKAAPALAREFLIDDALAGLALHPLYESVRSWLPPGGLVRLPVHPTIKYTPDAEPLLNLETVGSISMVELWLSLRWVADIWARGISVVDGCFVLEVLERRARGTALMVRALRWERPHRQGPPLPVQDEAIVVQTEDGSWHLGWRHAPDR